MFIRPVTLSARPSARACRSISATSSASSPCGGIEQALSPEWTPASSICSRIPATATVSPSQIVVSYFQGGRICDYINGKWGWDTLLAMLHDFGAGEATGAVIRKELKIEPDEFDKRFLEFIDTDTKNVVEHFDDWKKGLKKVADLATAKDYDGVIKEGTAIRDMYPDYVEEHSVYEALGSAYLAKGDKPAAIAELERYAKIGGRDPETLKLLAKQLEDAGRKKDAALKLAS